MAGSTTLIGRKLSGFKIVDILGEGGMGTVYRAVQSTLGRQVALKVLRKRLLRKDRNFARRFLKEARLAAQINHANIVQVYDVGVEGDIHFIALELVQGVNIGEALKEKGFFPEAQAVETVQQVAQGLAAAWSKNLIHRDIKPDNWLATPDGVVKIMDFGLAKDTADSTTATRAGVLMGTPPYISPEQVLGKDADQRSDLYSLGISLFELLTGHKPFTGESVMGVLMKHVKERVPDIDRLRPGLSALVKETLARLLEKEPDRRFADATALLEHIKPLATPDGERLLADFLFSGHKAAGSSPLVQLFQKPTAEKKPGVTSTATVPPPIPPSGRYISRGVIEIGPTDEDRRRLRKYRKMARDFERAAGWEKASGYYRKALGAGASGREEKEIRAAVARVEKRLKRQAEHLYRRARTALERGENRAAVILLDTYLGLQGSDASAGALRAQASQTPEGLRYLGINRHRHREYENMAAGYILVLLPGGESTMGGEKGSKDEKPAHRVVLPPHYMGKYPVTNAQYGRFLRWFSSAQGDHRHCHPAEPPGKDHVPAFQSDRRFSRAQHPVVGVDWFDAWAFASWAGLSLPSEAAWEAAAGAAGRNRFPWGDRLPDPDLCNFFDAHHGCTTPVDALRAGATASGLSDMAGNVLEWCLDWYNRKFYSRVGASGDNPCNTSETAKRVLRGGSWTSQADHCRCQKRGCDYPTARETHIGFRLVYGLPALPLVP